MTSSVVYVCNEWPSIKKSPLSVAGDVLKNLDYAFHMQSIKHMCHCQIFVCIITVSSDQ